MTQTASVARRSRFQTEWRPIFCLSAPELSLSAMTGQTATFTRASATTAYDIASAAYIVAHLIPAFEWCDTDADTVRDMPGVKLGTSDRLYFAYYGLPQPRTWLVEFRDDTATGAASGTRIFEIGDSATATGYLSVQRSADGYHAVHRNASASVTATVTCNVTAGDHAFLLVQAASTGAITLTAQINAAAPIVGAATGALAFATAWNQARLALGSDYAGNNRAAQVFLLLRELIGGTNTLATMQAG